jgi:hypothetical protein
MDLYAVMSEVDARLKTITGLRVAEFGFPGKVSPPAAVQYPPDRITFDQTYGRGSDVYEDHVVVVFVGMASTRAAMREIAPYLAGSGTKSVKAKLDMSGSAPYSSCADLQVQWAELDTPKMAGVDYLAALFHCKIIGSGA